MWHVVWGRWVWHVVWDRWVWHVMWGRWVWHVMWGGWVWHVVWKVAVVLCFSVSKVSPSNTCSTRIRDS